MSFVGIEMACAKCNILFFSKSKLQKHLKAGCMGVVQLLLSFSTLSTLPISLIESNLISQSLGLSLDFWDETYAITSIMLVPE